MQNAIGTQTLTRPYQNQRRIWSELNVFANRQVKKKEFIKKIAAQISEMLSRVCARALLQISTVCARLNARSTQAPLCARERRQ